ncbi:hypothetical protein H5410_050989 [Solanum commersonii]|uniref:Uncharacterized protein n=1 Tax=Solanum commersonii TaxID=4109 RepID=A0A9J5WX50_SOLCO|nr:hypothetical protein H5410_050989 [Solanum commersonii]
MDESITSLTEAIVSLVLLSEDILACSPTLVLSGAELVVVQSLASLRGDVQPTLIGHELRSFDVENDKEEEQEVPLKWSKNRVRGANTFTMDIPNLKTVKGTPVATFTVEHTECAKERKRKGKGKLVKTHSKGEKKKYETRSVTQKVMGSSITTNAIQMERIRKTRQEGQLPKEPTSTPVSIGTSETESDYITVHVTKQGKEVEHERVRSKGSQKIAKKSPMKRDKVRKQVAEKSKPVKGPGPRVQKQSEEKEMTREEQITATENQKVHEFFYKMKVLKGRGITTTVRNVEICLDEEY